MRRKLQVLAGRDPLDLAAGLALAEGVRAAAPLAAPLAARVSAGVRDLEALARR